MASLENYSPSLLGAMDKLWFHKVVLCAEPNFCPNKSPLQMMSPSSSPSSSSSESQQSSNSSSEPTDCSDDDDDVIRDFSYAVHGSLPIILTNHHPMDSEDEDYQKEGPEQEDDNKESTPKGPSVVMKRMNSSNTPIRRRIKTRLRLERTLSCKTLAELEQEEVKGFMDLGFNFDKDRLTPRTMSVIPGLQRLQGQQEDNHYYEHENVNAKEGEEDKQMIKGEARIRPHLSEAWLLKRPNSPLVRPRMSRPSTTSNDMKKHLKLWAKTVAYSAILDS